MGQAGAQSTVLPPLGGGDDGCEPHPPIHIREDEGLSGYVLGHEPVTGEPLYRPGSGIRSGNGTQQDPFVIEGWCFIVPAGAMVTDSAVALSIESTSMHVIVRGNEFLGVDTMVPASKGNAVVLDDASNVEIRDNLFGSLHHGLVALGAKDLRITGNTFGPTHAHAMILRGSHDAHVEGNMMDGQTGTVGIQSVASDGVVIMNNTLGGYSRGISLEGSFENRVQGNRVEGSSLDGTFVRAGGDHRIVQNGFTGNNWGLYVESLVGGVVEDNTFTGSQVGTGSDSVYIRESSGLRVEGNVFEGTREGVLLRVSDNITILGNRIRATSGVGVSLADAHENRIEGNRLEGVGKGIELLRSSKNTLWANQVSGSGRDGLIISDSVNNTVRASMFEDSAQDGVFLQNAHGNIIEENILSNNAWAGVSLTGSALQNVFHGNNIEGNDGYGLENWAGTKIEARNNWWGCEGGPGGLAPGCNGLLGKADVDPWLQAPNPDAGPPT